MTQHRHALDLDALLLQRVIHETDHFAFQVRVRLKLMAELCSSLARSHDEGPERQVTSGGAIARRFSAFHGWAVGVFLEEPVAEIIDGSRADQNPGQGCEQ